MEVPAAAVVLVCLVEGLEWIVVPAVPCHVVNLIPLTKSKTMSLL